MNAITNDWNMIRNTLNYTSSSVPTGNRVFRIGALAEWQVSALKQLAVLNRLQPNWNSYGSVAPADEVLNLASKLVTSVTIDSVSSPRVVPISGGGVQLAWTAGNRELQIEVDPSLRIDALQMDGDAVEYEGPLGGTIDQLVAWVESSTER